MKNSQEIWSQPAEKRKISVFSTTWQSVPCIGICTTEFDILLYGKFNGNWMGEWWLGGFLDGCMDGWADGWKDGLMDRWRN